MTSPKVSNSIPEAVDSEAYQFRLFDSLFDVVRLVALE